MYSILRFCLTACQPNSCHHGHEGKYARTNPTKFRHMCPSFERVYVARCLWEGKILGLEQLLVRAFITTYNRKSMSFFTH